MLTFDRDSDRPTVEGLVLMRISSGIELFNELLQRIGSWRSSLGTRPAHGSLSTNERQVLLDTRRFVAQNLVVNFLQLGDAMSTNLFKGSDY